MARGGPMVRIGDVEVGQACPLALIAGAWVIESREHALRSYGAPSVGVTCGSAGHTTQSLEDDSWMAKIRGWRDWSLHGSIRLRLASGHLQRIVVCWNAYATSEVEEIEYRPLDALVDPAPDMAEVLQFTSFDVETGLVDCTPILAVLRQEDRPDGATLIRESYTGAPYRAFDFHSRTDAAYLELYLPDGFHGLTPPSISFAVRSAGLRESAWEEGGYWCVGENLWSPKAQGSPQDAREVEHPSLVDKYDYEVPYDRL